MKNLQVFQNEQFGKIRTVIINNEPWFIGKDIVGILGYQNGSRDINRHVDEEDRQNYRNGTFESPRGLTLINESGLYSLILSSKLPQAKAFKRWVTHEVLPAIRKTGSYQLHQTLHQNVLSSIHAKMYNELPVLTLVDMQYLVNVPCFTLRYFIREHNPSPLIVDIDYFFLQGLSLLSYKAQNGYRTKNNSKLIVITKSGFIKICHYFDIGNAENALRLFNSTIDDMNAPAIKVPTKSNDTQTENSSAITQPNLYKAELIIKLIPTATDYIEKRFMHMAAMRILFGRGYSSSLDILRESLELKKELKKLDSKDKRLVKRAMKDSLPYKSLPKHLQGFLNETFA